MFLFILFVMSFLPCGTTEFDCSNFVDKSPRRVSEQSWQTKAVSTPVPVANRTLAYRALESGLRPHEVKIDRPRTVRAQLN